MRSRSALLAILVLADRRTAQCTDTGTDHCVLTTLRGAVAAEQACSHTDSGTDQRIATGAVLLLRLLAVLVALHIRAAGGASGQRNGAGQCNGKTLGGCWGHGVLLWPDHPALNRVREDKQTHATGA